MRVTAAQQVGANETRLREDWIFLRLYFAFIGISFSGIIFEGKLVSEDAWGCRRVCDGSGVV